MDLSKCDNLIEKFKNEKNMILERLKTKIDYVEYREKQKLVKMHEEFIRDNLNIIRLYESKIKDLVSKIDRLTRHYIKKNLNHELSTIINYINFEITEYIDKIKQKYTQIEDHQSIIATIKDEINNYNKGESDSLNSRLRSLDKKIEGLEEIKKQLII